MTTTVNEIDSLPVAKKIGAFSKALSKAHATASDALANCRPYSGDMLIKQGWDGRWQACDCTRGTRYGD